MYLYISVYTMDILFRSATREGNFDKTAKTLGDFNGQAGYVEHETFERQRSVVSIQDQR